MPYPDEAEGFQVDGPNSYTQFHKRFVSQLLSSVLCLENLF
jgi:hypothetical protein